MLPSMLQPTHSSTVLRMSQTSQSPSCNWCKPREKMQTSTPPKCSVNAVLKSTQRMVMQKLSSLMRFSDFSRFTPTAPSVQLSVFRNKCKICDSSLHTPQSRTLQKVMLLACALVFVTAQCLQFVSCKSSLLDQGVGSRILEACRHFSLSATCCPPPWIDSGP